MKLSYQWLCEWLKHANWQPASFQAVREFLDGLGLTVESHTDWTNTLAEFQVAQITKVTPHPHADRLQICHLKTATENNLQVVCGAPNVKEGMYSILALPGTRIPGRDFVLEAACVRDIESQGMLCSYSELGLDPKAFGDDNTGIIDLTDQAPDLDTSAAAALGVDDVIFEIEVTPNRGDLLAVRGVARDLLAAVSYHTKNQHILPTPAWPEIDDNVPEAKLFSVDDDAKDLCPAFSMVRLEGINSTAQPAAGTPLHTAIARLKLLGHNTGLVPVDITNYLTHDQARPLHTFDADKIQGMPRITLAQGGEPFDGLDGKIYRAPKGAIIIVDTEGVIAIAGVMGGARTAVSATTTNILLEAAAFAPKSVSRTSRTMGLITDASLRFERGVDPASMVPGLTQTITLLRSCNPDLQVVSQHVWAPHYPQSPSITFDPAHTARHGGLAVDKNNAAAILSNLGFAVTDDESTLAVTPPSWRFDIVNRNCLVEEVTRVVGFETIPCVPLPPLSGELTHHSDAAWDDTRHRFNNTIRNLLAGRGLKEVITWSMIAQEQAKLFEKQVKPAQLVWLDNPISQDMQVMRPSLLPGLLNTLSQTHKRARSIEQGLFEIGRTYLKTAAGYQETEMVAGLIIDHSTPSTHTSWRTQTKRDFWAAKAHVLAVLAGAKLNLDTLHTQQLAEEACGHIYHPGQAGQLVSDQQTWAHVFALHPRMLARWDLPFNVWGFEIALEPLCQNATHAKRGLAPTFSTLQPLTRDVAVIAPSDMPAVCISGAVRAASGTLFSALDVFDVFEDADKLGTDKKSLAVRVYLQPQDTSLEDTQIQAVMGQITDALEQLPGVSLREV